MVLAGDVVDGGNVEISKPVIDALTKLASAKNRRSIPIAAAFGNEEYMGLEEMFKGRYPEVIWIDDEYFMLDIKSTSICIVSSRGALRKPTSWRRRNTHGIECIYETRLNRIKNSLRECNRQSISILVAHYASTHATLHGESSAIYDYLWGIQ